MQADLSAARQQDYATGLNTGLSIETAAYGLLAAFTALRNLLGLGKVPLSPAESADALYAWYTAFAKTEVLADLPLPSSGLHNVLLLFSYWMGFDGNWISRFWPALFGVIIVLAPLALRKQIGRYPALLAALFLFLSPAIWAVSQTVSGDALGIGLLVLLAWQIFERDTPNWTTVGILLGLGLASGAMFISGLLIAIVALLVARVSFAGLLENGRQVAVPFIVTFLASTSIVLLYRSGLAVGAAGVGAWFSAWFGTADPRPWWLVLGNLGLYEPLLLLTGVLGIGVLFKERNNTATGLSVVVLSTLVFSVIYPGRSSALTVFAVLPLAVLAAIFVMDLLSGEWDEESKIVVPLQMLILLIPLVFAVMNLSNFARDFTPDLEMSLRWQTALFAGGGFLIAILMSGLFAFGWNMRDALISSYLAVAVLLIVQTISGGVALTQNISGRSLELWYDSFTDQQALLLVDSVAEAARRNTPIPTDSVIVTVADPLHPLAWLLRHYDLQFASAATPSEDVSVPLALTPSTADSTLLAQSYLGQDFRIVSYNQVNPNHFGEWVRYVLYREVAKTAGSNDYRIVPETTPDYTVWVHPNVHFYKK